MLCVSSNCDKRTSERLCPEEIQWNLDITKDRGTGKICSLFRGFVMSRFFFIYFTITEVKKVVRYIEDLNRGSCYSGSTLKGNSLL